MSLRTRDRFPLYVFTAAFLIRALFIIIYSHTAYPDENTWSALAAALASGGGFVSNLRPPGYVAFLGLIYKIFGNGNYSAVFFAQALLGSLQAAMIYFLAFEMFGMKKVARIAAAVTAFYPYLIFFSAHILSETLFSFFIVAAVTFLYLGRTGGRRENIYFAAAGLSSGLAVLTKSTLLAVFPLLVLWFILNRITLKNIVLFFILPLAVVAPWTARNYVHYGALVPVTPSGSYFFQAYNPKTLAIEKATRRLANVEWYTEEYEEIAQLPVMVADREYKRRAIEFIKKNPSQVMELMSMRFFHFWRFWPLTNSILQRIAAFIFSFPVIILGLAGMYMSRRRWKELFLPAALFFTFNAVHTVFICTLRYRIPVDFVLILYAAYAAVRLLPYKEAVQS